MSVPASATVGRVDVHSHIIPPALPDLAAIYGNWDWPSVACDGESGCILVGGRHFRTIDHRCWSPSVRQGQLDADAVDLQIVSPVPVTFCYNAPVQGTTALARHQNDFLAGFVGTAPNRFVPLGTVPLQDSGAAIAELYRCVRELGFAGIEIGTSAAGRELGDPAYSEFFAAAEEINALLFVHPEAIPAAVRLAPLDLIYGIGMPSETALAAAQIIASGTLATYPRLKVCLAHGGGSLPMLLPRLDHAWRVLPGLGDRLEHPPSHYARMMLADTLTYDPHCLRLAVESFGAEHLMIGTDAPFAAAESPPGATVDSALDAGLIGGAEHTAISGANARAIFQRDGNGLHSTGQPIRDDTTPEARADRG